MPQKLLALLSPAERRRAYLLLGMILVMAFLEMLGVASILPFMAVLANPAVVETHPYLARAYQGLGFSDPDRFLFFLGVGVFGALIVSIAFKAPHPKCLHEQPVFAGLGYQWGDFPEAERASREVLSLPMHPGLTEREQDRVVAALRAAVGDGA